MPDDTDNRQGGCTRAMLVAGVVPLVVALAVGAALRFQSIASTESAMARTIERSWEREAEVYLLEFARRLAFETHRVMAERIDNAREWASTPTIRNAARTGAAQHEAQPWFGKPIGIVESQFETRKSLGRHPEAVEMLKEATARRESFVEIFITDRHGYNVAVSNPTSDFVQSDEDWWQRAWENGVDVGEVELDESAGALAIDISTRIDGRSGGEEPLGVMKAVLSLAEIQELATQFAQETGTQVIVTDVIHHIMADTAHDHSSDRIGNDAKSLLGGEFPVLSKVLFSGSQGASVGQSWMAGYVTIEHQDVSAVPVPQWTVIVLKQREASNTAALGLESHVSGLSGQALLGIAWTALASVVVLAVIIVVASRTGRRRG